VKRKANDETNQPPLNEGTNKADACLFPTAEDRNTKHPCLKSDKYLGLQLLVPCFSLLRTAALGLLRDLG